MSALDNFVAQLLAREDARLAAAGWHKDESLTDRYGIETWRHADDRLLFRQEALDLVDGRQADGTCKRKRRANG